MRFMASADFEPTILRVVPSGYIGGGTTPLPLINKPGFPFDVPHPNVRN